MTTVPHEMGREEREYSLGIVAGGTTMEWLAGCAAWILAIIGLAGFLPHIMLGVGILCASWALLSEGGAMMGRFMHLLTRAETNLGTVGFSGGTTAEFLAGVAGIPLGILVLMGIQDPWLPAATLVFYGGALCVGAWAKSQVNLTALGHRPITDAALVLAQEAVSVSSGSRVLAGLAVVALGVIALTGRLSEMLSLIALLVVGATLFLSGAAISGRVVGIFARRHD